MRISDVKNKTKQKKTFLFFIVLSMSRDVFKVKKKLSYLLLFFSINKKTKNFLAVFVL